MRLLWTIVLAALAGSALEGFERTLDRRAIEVARAIGLAPLEADRRQFHAAYHIEVGEPPVDYLEIVTPFRRVVLAAEQAAQATGRGITQREAFEALGDDPRQVDLIVELTFHPLNTFIGVPAYDVELEETREPDERVEPTAIARVPRHGPRVGDPLLPTPMPPPVRAFGASEPLLGGSLIATFAGRRLEATGRYEVVIREGETEIARARVDLGGFR